MKWYPFQIFLPPAGLITFAKVANFIRKRYLTGQMYNVQPFWGEEFLDSGHLGRGKIQEMLQEYIPLSPGPFARFTFIAKSFTRKISLLLLTISY